jgi:hypothetical protein
MARYMAGAKTTDGGTVISAGNAQPSISLYNIASRQFKLREVGLFNTTNTACDELLVRLTATGTQGTALVEAKYDSESADPFSTAFNSHTADAAGTVDHGYRASLGAAIGAGVIWTFGDTGAKVAAGTANGLGLCPENGTGQILQAYFVWDE